MQQYLDAAQTDYTNALAALASGDLGGYQTNINAMQQNITMAQQALGTSSASTTPSTTTTTTVPTKSKSTKTSAKTPTSTEPATSTTATSLATASPSG